MIILGTMNITRTRDSGNFYCPTCGVNQPFRLRARRPWLTIYFIPTVPVGGAEEFVLCDSCRSSWDPSVLTMDEAQHVVAQESQFREEALRSAVLVTLADDQVSEDEIVALQRIGTRLLERDIDRDELGQLWSIARENKITAINYVLTASNRWSTEQRAARPRTASDVPGRDCRRRNVIREDSNHAGHARCLGNDGLRIRNRHRTSFAVGNPVRS